MRHSNNSACNRNHGFSMIEVLVTLMVLSIGLLGLAAMQANSIQNTHGAYVRTQATYLAYDMLDRMRANMTGVTANDYDNIDTVTNDYLQPGCITADCTPAEMAAHDAAEWEVNLAAQLPSGQGTIIAAAGINVFTITVTWGVPDPDTGITPSFDMTSQL